MKPLPSKCECGCTRLRWIDDAYCCWRCGLVLAKKDGADVPLFDGRDVRAWLRRDAVRQMEMGL